MVFFAAWTWSFVVVFLFCKQVESGKTVSVDLNAPWKSHELSPFGEAAEFLYDIDTSTGVAYVEHLLNVGASGKNEEIPMKQMAIDNADGIVSDLMKPFLGTTLAIRSLAPRMEFNRQLYLSLHQNMKCQESQLLVFDDTSILHDSCSNEVSTICSVVSKVSDMEGSCSSSLDDSCSARTNENELSDLLDLEIDEAKFFKRVEMMPNSSLPLKELSVLVTGILHSTEFSTLLSSFESNIVSCTEASGFNIVFNIYLRFVNGLNVVTNEEPTPLQGWSVSLDLKNTEYLTMNTEDESDLKAEEKLVEEDIKQLGALVTDRFFSKGKKHGFSAALEDLQNIAYNFPRYAPKFKSKSPSPERYEALMQFSTGIQAMLRQNSFGKVFINGIAAEVGSENFNIFSFLKKVQDEQMHIKNLNSLGLSDDQVGFLFNALYSTQVFPTSIDVKDFPIDLPTSVNSKEQDILIDLVSGSKGNILFLNNIEKDKIYSKIGYTKNLQVILQPLRQIAPIQKNLYTWICFLDMTTRKGQFVLQQMQNLVSQYYPIRVGLVFANDGNLADDQCGNLCFLSLFLFVRSKTTKSTGLEFLKLLAESNEAGTNGILIPGALAGGQNFLRSHGVTVSMADLEHTISLENEKVVKVLQKMDEYRASKNIAINSLTLNGQIMDYDDVFQQDSFATFINTAVFLQQRNFAELIWEKHITAKTDVFKFLVNPKRSNVYSKFSFLLAEKDDQKIFVPLPNIKSLAEKNVLVPTVHLNNEKAELLIVALDYCSPDVADFIEALGRAVQNNFENINILFAIPRNVDQFCAIDKLAKLLPLLGDEQYNWQEIQTTISGNTERTPNDLLVKVKDYNRILLLELERKFNSFSMDSEQILEKSFFIVNGRYVALPQGQLPAFSDLDVFFGNYIQKRVGTLANFFLSSVTESKISYYELVSNIGVLEKQASERSFLEFSTFPESLISSNNYTGLLQVAAEIDPLSELSLNVVPVLRLLHTRFKFPIRVVLLPKIGGTEMPLPKFHRSALGLFSEGSSVVFNKLPKKHILTMKIFSPEPWIVNSLDTSSIDIDNILLASLSNISEEDINIKFRLDNVLVTGHCFKMPSRKPATGVQLQLLEGVSYEEPKILGDTVVMRNIGYFQMKANPGLFNLQLVDNENSLGYTMKPLDFKELKSFDSVGKKSATDIVADVRSKKIILKDFIGDTNYISLLKQNFEPEVANKEDDATGDSLWDRVGSFLTSTLDKSSKQNQKGYYLTNENGYKLDYNDTIHVFSIASGALYERFLKIMFYSVVSNTKNPVKFWIVGNFLSPTFRQDIECLSKQLDFYSINRLERPEGYQQGFDYEIVTYRWPQWLNEQTEKQRIIWGYKILFLDVLFPLDVKKIVYVDADQVVRTDLKEIFEINLHEKVYGFTPFCGDKEETLGFQFWRQGYWQNHLQGHPYHISALFVVDLELFRKRNVGDKLREVYSVLSRDKNSLSNLDQDLPNYAQHDIPIHSLDQSWLWCESWCSDSTKRTSKTIDLCNNPLHKEPKLSMAKRVINGPLFSKNWEEMDTDIEMSLQSCANS